MRPTTGTGRARNISTGATTARDRSSPGSSAAAASLAGSWSVEQTGNLALAVRLPAVVCGSLLLVSLYVLTVQVYRREVLALAVVGTALTLPLIAVGSSLMTIDAPYTCCWGWALVLGHRAIFRGSSWAWPLLGLVLGLGILAKYTMIVWVPSAALFLLTTPEYRRLLWSRGFWMHDRASPACAVCRSSSGTPSTIG